MIKGTKHFIVCTCSNVVGVIADLAAFLNTRESGCVCVLRKPV